MTTFPYTKTQNANSRGYYSSAEPYFRFQVTTSIISQDAKNNNSVVQITLSLASKRQSSGAVWSGYGNVYAPYFTVQSSTDGTNWGDVFFTSSKFASYTSQGKGINSFIQLSSTQNVVSHDSSGNATVYYKIVWKKDANNQAHYDPVAPTTIITDELQLPTIIQKPIVSDITISNISDKSFVASFTSNGVNATNAIQLSIDNFATVLQSASGTSTTFSSLDANRTYYVRGLSSNVAGETYTNVKQVTTTYVSPSSPNNVALKANTTDTTLGSLVTATWGASSPGSNSVSGYRLTIYKNDTALNTTNVNALSYTFGTLESLGFNVGDNVKVELSAYSKDWSGTNHYSDIVSSNVLNVVSDKFIYVSQNGGSFNKCKMFISVNGGTFREVKKEDLKII